MTDVALVGLVDTRGWLLLQERDSQAPTDPDRWSLPGGAVEPGETPLEAAHRELLEETALRADLRDLGRRELPCALHGTDVVHLFAGTTTAGQADVVCGEGRQMVFVEPAVVPTLDLTEATRALWREVAG